MKKIIKLYLFWGLFICSSSSIFTAPANKVIRYINDNGLKLELTIKPKTGNSIKTNIAANNFTDVEIPGSVMKELTIYMPSLNKTDILDSSDQINNYDQFIITRNLNPFSKRQFRLLNDFDLWTGLPIVGPTSWQYLKKVSLSLHPSKYPLIASLDAYKKDLKNAESQSSEERDGAVEKIINTMYKMYFEIQQIPLETQQKAINELEAFLKDMEKGLSLDYLNNLKKYIEHLKYDIERAGTQKQKTTYTVSDLEAAKAWQAAQQKKEADLIEQWRRAQGQR